VSEILATVQNATPALAAVIIGLLFTVRSQGKEIEQLKKRVEKYDSMELGTKLANIEVNIEWIKRKLEEG
jgi:hypothetical protein